MNIVDLKNKFDELSCNLIREYTVLEKKYIEEKDKNTKELTHVNSISESMVGTLEKNDIEINGYKDTLAKKDLLITQLRNEIHDLHCKVTEVSEEMDGKTKFDMIRAQADEIHAKSQEIERLAGIIQTKNKRSLQVDIEELVVNDNHTNDMEETGETTDELTDELTDEVIDEGEQESGFEIKAPLQKFLLGVPVEQLEQDEVTDEVTDEPEEKGVVVEEKEVVVVEEVVVEEKEVVEEEVEESFSIVKYRKVMYYIDESEPPNVYTILDDEDIGEKIGTWEKNDKGKKVLVKNKSSSKKK